MLARRANFGDKRGMSLQPSAPSSSPQPCPVAPGRADARTRDPAQDRSRTRGLRDGLLGVLIFSASLPATRLAVVDLPPLFLTGARAVLAALLAVLVLAGVRAPRPARGDLLPLAVVAAGCVLAFPLLTALALRELSAARAMVFTGLLPLATAACAVWRGGARPRPVFWLCALAGAACVGAYALALDASASGAGDALMAAAVLACGAGYAEGARLTPRLGGWQVICWALVLAVPAMALLTLATWPADLSTVRPSAWAGLAYVSVFSMLVGFVFWYRGLARGGVAAVSQLQLLQPFLGLGLAAVLLGEPVRPAMVATALAVIACVAAARRWAR
ncbi:MAG: putative inner rane transport protein [Pseudomonadota bacterium]